MNYEIELDISPLAQKILQKLLAGNTVNERTLFGHIIIGLLRKRSVGRPSPEHEQIIKFQTNWVIMRYFKGAYYLLPRHCHFLEQLIIDYFYEKMFSYVSLSMGSGRMAKYAVLEYRKMYDLEEEDIGYWTMVKRYQRWRDDLFSGLQPVKMTLKKRKIVKINRNYNRSLYTENHSIQATGTA